MRKTYLLLRNCLVLCSLLLLLTRCDTVEDLLGFAESNPSDIKAGLFKDDFMKECVALQTAGLNADEVYDIFCAGNGVSSIAGLEQFSNLRTLMMPGNRLSDVDLSPFSNLQYLDLSANRLNEINLRHNPLLKQAFLDLNSLNELDVSNNAQLLALVLSDNDISALDLSHNPALEELVLDQNAFTGSISDGPNPLLNLKKNSKLINLNLFDNDITYIDVSKNPRLDILDLRQNQLLEIDVSFNQNLTELRLNDNQLSALDISNNNELDKMLAENNLITRIDLPLAGKLRFLFLRNNLIDCDASDCNGQNNFVIPDNDNLIHIDLSENLLSNNDIILLQNEDFSELLLADNPSITGTFDLSAAKRLIELNLDGTGVTDFDFGPTPVNDYVDFFQFFSMKVLSVIGAPLNQNTQDLLDEFQANKKKHPLYDPDNPDAISFSY